MGVRTSRHEVNNNTTINAGHGLDYKSSKFFDERGGTNRTPATGMVATGGVINFYQEGGSFYQSHIFTSPGSFVVSDLSTVDSNNEIDILLVGGGGAARSSGGGGGGGGGLEPLLQPVSETTYTITIGIGGEGEEDDSSDDGGDGGTTILGITSTT